MAGKQKNESLLAEPLSNVIKLRTLYKTSFDPYPVVWSLQTDYAINI